MKRKNNKQARIRRELSKDPTQTAKQIAQKVGCSHQLVAYTRMQLKKGREARMAKLYASTFGDAKIKIQGDPIVFDATPQQEEAMNNVNAIQIGGDHYKKQTLQPWDAITEWGLDFLAGNVVKYVVRHKDKGGVEDLKKARHYLDKLIEVEGAK